ncbi:ribosome-associated translation inhibitor RaiA [Weissella soli]|uniref:ribosome hibernation-promoting factor, HPF/YfiA family n=1 Tax=Weissella soli TaxID=155866 RepID=UPI0021BE955D|nr:ribosome-associated translation inhibitor RaiA [Weissella soli]MCT8394532.1 ribosome-associated translation inhibitor RaiA [Weissella soli]
MLGFIVRGENLEITEAMREYVEKRLVRLEHYLNDDNRYDAHVNVKSYKDGSHKIEVTIQLPYLLLRAEDTEKDLYQAVDFVSEKLERQIRKHKTKVNRKSREKGFKGIEQLDFTAEVEAEEDEAPAIEIVRTKHLSLKPMDAEEAVLQMDLLGHDFFVFEEAETGNPSVVYKRKDGKYAVIDAEA